MDTQIDDVDDVESIDEVHADVDAYPKHPTLPQQQQPPAVTLDPVQHEHTQLFPAAPPPQATAVARDPQVPSIQPHALATLPSSPQWPPPHAARDPPQILHAHAPAAAAPAVATLSVGAAVPDEPSLKRPAPDPDKPKIKRVQGVTCYHCRVAKTKCDLAERAGCGKCARCERLNLNCFLVPLRRGRKKPIEGFPNPPSNAQGPKPRAAKPTNSAAAAQPAGGASPGGPPYLAGTPVCDDNLFTPECAHFIISSVNTHHGLLTLFWNWLQMALRSRNCGVMAEVMQLAYSYHLALDDFIVPMAMRLPLLEITEDLMPPGVRQWYDSDQMCIVRAQMDGLIGFFPNKSFVEHIGTLESLEMRVPISADRPVSPLCAAEVLCSFIVRASHRGRFLWILSSMWSHVYFDNTTVANEGPNGMSSRISKVVEMTFNDVVDVELAPKLGNAVTPLAPCTLRGRIQTCFEHRASWMCLEFRHVELRPAPISATPMPALSMGMAPTMYGSPSAAKRGAAMQPTRPLNVQMPINFSGAGKNNLNFSGAGNNNED